MNTATSGEYSRDGQDGFRPLPLPPTGELLLPGRQYYLSPEARLAIFEVFGLKGLPSVILCLQRKVGKTTIVTTTTNHDTGVVTTRTDELDRQNATFQYYIGNSRHAKFTLDLDKVEEMKPFYKDSPKLKSYEESDSLKKRATAFRHKVGSKPKKEVDLSILDI